MSKKDMRNILVIGAAGQIGSHLTAELRRRYGRENVIAADKRKPNEDLMNSGPFEYVDVTDRTSIAEKSKEYSINAVCHLAAILSVAAEENPGLAWHVNVDGLHNVLQVAKEQDMARVFWPSSIAVFSPEAPRIKTPQDTVQIPRTIYGVSKVAGELLCNYFFHRHGVDARVLRYPGIISSETLPGGGTTDYAVAIFYEAVKNRRYTCYLRENTVLPMMYIVDCIRAAVEVLEAHPDKIGRHVGYNVAAFSFSPGELASEIRKHIPDFECKYEPDFRQKIADSWPMSIDDSVARSEWGWMPSYDLPTMTGEMIERLRKRSDEGRL